MPSEAIIQKDGASEKERTSRFVRAGFPRITSDVLSLCPYLPLEDAD